MNSKPPTAPGAFLRERLPDLQALHVLAALTPGLFLGAMLHAVPLAGAGAGDGVARDESEALIDLGKAEIVTQDAEARLEAAAPAAGEAEAVGRSATVLSVRTGMKAPWPGITVKAPGGVWRLERRRWLSVDLRNAGAREVRLHCRVDNPGADGRRHCVTESVVLPPGACGAATIPLSPRWFEPGQLKLVGMRGNPPVEGELDPSQVSAILVFIDHPHEAAEWELRGIRVGGLRELEAPPTTATFLPMIDELGQYAHATWPGKARSAADLLEARRQEDAELSAHPGSPGRDRFGGWAEGPQLAATGFFRVEKHAGKWWLVDPEGRLFWSHGVDCVQRREATPIRDREGYFRWLPEDTSPFARFYGQSSWAPHGYYAEHTPYKTFDFRGANLLRKYGEGFEEEFAERAHRRLASWGLNTVGNWSDGAVGRMGRTPYVATLETAGRRIEGSEGYWGRFPDPFDGGFRARLARRLDRERETTASDPWCIGYFVDNELGWGDETALAVGALRSPADQPAKVAFVGDLRGVYGDIERLNGAWRTTHTSWEALLESRGPPEVEPARQDLVAFAGRIAEEYFRVVQEELKAAAPRHLYLGCRFAWVNDVAAQAAARHTDVVCYNRYTYSVRDLRIPGGIDRPVIIGEFHFGALDRGLFHPGLRAARDQEHRAALYRDYVLGAVDNPLVVGTHWFQYADQPATGRGDGENYQIGLVDVCDRPYPELIAACREVGRLMYRRRLGQP